MRIPSPQASRSHILPSVILRTVAFLAFAMLSAVVQPAAAAGCQDLLPVGSETQVVSFSTEGGHVSIVLPLVFSSDRAQGRLLGEKRW